MQNGYKVITTETHGLSQRGGKVTCFLRFGNEISAPIPMMGSTDMIITTEKSCVLDVLKYSKPDRSTKLIISDYEKKIIGIEYPSESYLLEILYDYSDRVYLIPAKKVAEKLIGNLKVINIVILGYILRFLPLNKDEFKEHITQYFLGKDSTINLKAFNGGFEIK